MLGTAATATLLRRAVQQLGDRRADLKDLVIRREGLVYTFSVPASWHERHEEDELALRDIVQALRPILVALTGKVVLRRLARVGSLRAWGLFGEDL